MSISTLRKSLYASALVLTLATVGGSHFLDMQQSHAEGEKGQAAPAPATPVSVAVVQPKLVTQWSEFSGRLEAVDEVDVRSRVAGAIQSVAFKEGAIVKQGDLLVKIDPAPYEAEVARSKAQVASAQSKLAYAKSELERGKQLVTSRFASQSDYDQRLNVQISAQADLEAAQAVLQTAMLNLDWTDIRAPISVASAVSRSLRVI
ncbi:MAG TPA: efflux RND transporter periplasmic adaptor subunit [Phyllobacterium sp.]|nr:efflux RND transporter periplasmic adaptor subunit [Phyllobacterium sp.]